MKVYVVETREPDDKGIAGVYSTVRKAMTAYPAGVWQKSEYGGWRNGLRGDDAASITEYELDEGV